jgi:peptidoglycan/LPS O-acetylase OafA/YrhL
VTTANDLSPVTERQSRSSRLQALDALRGIAAIAVVAFHYTTNLQYNYPQFRPAFSIPHGHFGVELFFIVSGFVIFMSLGNARSATDFAASRFARLFPAYWAAVLLTATTLATGGLPDRTLTLLPTLFNLTMLQEFFGLRHVDGVYWTLSRELVFYAGMATLLIFRQIARTHLIVGSLLALQAAISIAVHASVIALPGRHAPSLLLYPYFHLFAAGIALYGIHRDTSSRRNWLLLAATVVCELLLPRPDGGNLGHLIVLSSIGAVWMATTGRLQWLVSRPLLWLGSISYALYLIHQNIGYWLIHHLTAAGWSLPAATLAALALALALAHALRNLVEEPSRRAINQWWKSRQQLAAITSA